MNRQQTEAEADRDIPAADATNGTGQPEAAGDEPPTEPDNYTTMLAHETQGYETITDQKLLYKAMRTAKRNAKRTLLFQAIIRALPNLPRTDRNKLVDFTTKDGRRVRFRYPGLDKILENVLKPLRDEGIGLYFTINGRRLIGNLVHNAGGRAKAWLRIPRKLDAAELQSELTKRRRYILIALVNMAAEETEDSLPRGSERTTAPRGTRTRTGAEGSSGRAATQRTQQRPGPQNRPAGAAAGGEGAGPGPAGSARPTETKPPAGNGSTPRSGEKPSTAPAATPRETRVPTGTRTREASSPRPTGKPKAANLNAADPKPAPSTEKPVPAAPATTPTAPPPADPSRPMGWLYENNETSNRLRELLPQLNPKQAADLRKRFRDKPAEMLAEAETLHKQIYGEPERPAPEGAPTPAAEATTSKTTAAESTDATLDKAFSTLQMPSEDEEALRTEYSGRDEELLALLRRMWGRRTGQSEGTE